MADFMKFEFYEPILKAGKAYMRDMVMDHEKDVKEFQKEAKKAKDGDLKNFVESTLPTLRYILGKAGKLVVGIPRAMSMIERYPFWHRYFTGLGLDVVPSRQTDPRIAADGLDMAIAQPCFPVQIAHGHVKALADMGVDYIFVPNLLNAESNENSDCTAHLCPWNQTLPFVLKSNPPLQEHWNKILAPTLHFQLGRDFVKKTLAEMAQKLGVNPDSLVSALENVFIGGSALSIRA